MLLFFLSDRKGFQFLNIIRYKELPFYSGRGGMLSGNWFLDCLLLLLSNLQSQQRDFNERLHIHMTSQMYQKGDSYYKPLPFS